MALFNPKNDEDYQKALRKVERAREKGIYVEITEKAEQTQNQNNYLHLCLAYFANYFGYTPDYVKVNFFKGIVNRDLFVVTRKDRFGRDYVDMRHSYELTKDEISLAIDRWVKWCAETADFPMPDPDDYHVCMWLRKQLQNKKQLVQK